MIADISGSSLDLDRGHVVAGNPRTLGALMKMIGPHVPAELR